MRLFPSLFRHRIPSADALERERAKSETQVASRLAQLEARRDRLKDRGSRTVAQYFQDRIYMELQLRAKLGLPLYDLPIWTTRASHDPMQWGWSTDMALARKVGGPMRLSQLMRDFDFQKMVEDRLRESLVSNHSHALELIDFERFDGGPGRGQSDWLITVARAHDRPPERPTVSFVPEAAAPLAPSPVEPLESERAAAPAGAASPIGFGRGPH